MMRTPHILVVEDDREIRTMVSRFLQKQGYRVTQSEDARLMDKALAAASIDLILLDIMLPGGEDGLSICRRVRAISSVPIIMLTAAGDTTARVVGLEMGADDYIAKPFSQRLVVERVKAVLRRFQPKEPGSAQAEAARVLERGKLRLDPERHTCHWDNHPVMLTVTEFLILQALATRPGVVKTRDALMDAAYDDQVYVDDRTIDSHIKRLRKKFKGSDDDFDMIETLYGVGYRFKEM
jgi:two-component system, OmpR family, response regulator ChvI